MVERSYMVVDPRRDHSMQIPRPDLSDKLETPNACIRCHDHKDKSNRWAAEYCQEWYGDLQEGQTHYGESFYAGRRGYPEARAGLLLLASDENTPPMVRSTALHLLQSYPDQGSLSVLKEAVKDPDPLVRASAVQSFSMVNEEERFPLLKNLLKDPVRLVRVRTAFALAGTRRDSLSTGERTLLDQVLEEYKQVQYYNADHPTAHLNLGVLATLQGNYEEAEKSYRIAIEKEPVLPFGYINLADLYRTQRREADGETVLLSALDRNPNLADIHHALGLLYVRIKKNNKALAHLKKAVELEPENARYSYVYGIGLNSSGRTLEAIQFLGTALERHPYDRELLYALATISRDQGNIEEALKYTRRLIDAYPQIPTFRQLEKLLLDMGSGQDN
jgi:Flp pilus assembly protein TadD